MSFWLIVLLVLVVLEIAALPLIVPAHITLTIDTPARAASADMRLLWGLAPKLRFRAAANSRNVDLMQAFDDVTRTGYALLTPDFFDVAFGTFARLLNLKRRAAHIGLGLNLGDFTQNFVVQTTLQAALAAAPAKVSNAVTLSARSTPGFEAVGRVEIGASPLQLYLIYDQFRGEPATEEFYRRMRGLQQAQHKA